MRRAPSVSTMSKPRTQRKPSNSNHVLQKQNQQPQRREKQASWAVVRGLLTCKNVQIQQSEVKQPNQKQQQRKLQQEDEEEEGGVPEGSSKKCKKMRSSGSLCNDTTVMARAETGSPETHKVKRASLSACNSTTNRDASSNRSIKTPLNELNGVVVTASSSNSGSFRGMPFMRLSGCYECRMVVDPLLGFTRDPSLRASICPCPHCGEVFMKPENLELHQAVKHAGTRLSLYFPLYLFKRICQRRLGLNIPVMFIVLFFVFLCQIQKHHNFISVLKSICGVTNFSI